MQIFFTAMRSSHFLWWIILEFLFLNNILFLCGPRNCLLFKCTFPCTHHLFFPNFPKTFKTPFTMVTKQTHKGAPWVPCPPLRCPSRGIHLLLGLTEVLVAELIFLWDLITTSTTLAKRNPLCSFLVFEFLLHGSHRFFFLVFSLIFMVHKLQTLFEKQYLGDSFWDCISGSICIVSFIWYEVLQDNRV